MPVKTRADIYGAETTDILREISMYPGIQESQLCRFHPGKEEKVKLQLSHLLKQSRIERELSGGYVPKGGFESNADQHLVKAVWVLLDFIDRVEYHSACDFPVKIVFFREGEEFEIIYAPYGQEGLIAQAMLNEEKMLQLAQIGLVTELELLDMRLWYLLNCPRHWILYESAVCGTTLFYKLVVDFLGDNEKGYEFAIKDEDYCNAHDIPYPYE